MSSSFKILFFLKKGKGYLTGPLPVYLRISINSKRAEMSIQRSCEPKRWNQKSRRAAGSTKEAQDLNSYLDALQGRIYEVQKEFTLKKQPLSAEIAIARLTDKRNERQHSLIGVFQYHNEQFEKLVGLEYSIGTLKKFKTALSSLKSFLSWKFQLDDICLEDVNHQFLTEYEFYLKTVRKMEHNSAMGNLKKLKKIVRQCIANDWLDKDPFKSYKITTKETYRNYLTQEELETLTNKRILVKRLDIVKDIFLFSCYTGLSYSDIIDLTASHVNIGIDGEKWIYTKRNKTGVDSRIPLLPIVKDILSRYSNDPGIKHSNRLLPSLSNQRLNSYLKELADMCGFEKELTFHCARHTFATTVTLTNGVPIETVGKMLGHKNLRTTQIYAKILDKKVSEDMQVLKARLAKASGSN